MDDLISKQEAIDRLSEVLSSEEEFEIAKRVINEAPTVYEKEIIRKDFERVVERLEEARKPCKFLQMRIDDAIKIVKEECGINGN